MEEHQEKHCQDCKYFIQHYVNVGGAFRPTYDGHCRSPRLRDKKPDTPACHRFVQREGGPSAGEILGLETWAAT